MSHAAPAPAFCPRPTTTTPISSLDDLHPRERRSAMKKVTCSWVFGAIWATTIGGAPFTMFAYGLGATELYFGLLVAMPFLATLLSLPASLWIDASGARKRIFMISMLTQRLVWLGIAIVPTLLYRSGWPVGPQLALFTFMALMALHHITGAIGGPAWVSWMADLVPDPIRGRYFARRRQWGIISSIPAAWIAGIVLDTFARDGDPTAAIVWAAILFGVTSLAGIADVLLFQFVPDVAPQHATRPQKGAPILGTLVRPLKDKQFVWFCLYVAMLTMAVAPMGQFANLYLVEKLGIKSTQIQLMMLVAPLLGQFLIVPIWGRMADRYGRKPMMAISTFGLVPVGLGWCLMNLGYGWLGYVLSVSGAMLWAAVEIANFNLVLEMSGSADADAAKDGKGAAAPGGGSGYMSVNSVISAIAGVIGGLGAGWLMYACRNVSFTLGFAMERPFGAYEILFAASALARLIAGVVFLPRLHEPTARPTSEALVFMTSNLYSNLVGVVAAPIRRVVEALTPEPEPMPIRVADRTGEDLEADTLKLPLGTDENVPVRRAG
jgi:MFS family permease